MNCISTISMNGKLPALAVVIVNITSRFVIDVIYVQNLKKKNTYSFYRNTKQKINEILNVTSFGLKVTLSNVVCFFVFFFLFAKY